MLGQLPSKERGCGKKDDLTFGSNDGDEDEDATDEARETKM